MNNKTVYSKKYPSLTEENAKSLDSLIKKAKSLTNNTNSKAHNAAQRLSFMLLLGVEESKQEGFEIITKDEQKISELKELEDLYEICYNISNDIVTKIADLANGYNKQDFFTKFKLLYTALSNPENKQLRYNLLSNALSPDQ